MAMTLARKIYPISEVKRETGEWTCLVQVVERHRSQVSSGKHGTQKIFRRYVLADEHGTKVSGVVYENDIRYFSATLMPFKRYLISNANLIPAISFFKLGKYGYTWVINNKVPVEPYEEPIPPPLSFTYHVADFADLFKHADADVYFNIKALAIHAFPIKQINEDSSHRELVIIDESKHPMILTLWASFGDDEGSVIAKKLPEVSVIIATNVKATTFHGFSLTSRLYSYFLINPPLADTHTIKAWYNDHKAEIDKLMKDKVYRDPNFHYPPPTVNDVISVSEAIVVLPVKKTAWVSGQPIFVPRNKNYWYNACMNCHKELYASVEWVLKCGSCLESVGIELRSRVPIELTEGENVLHVTLESPDFENLTAMTAQMLKDANEFGFPIENDLKEVFNKIQIVCFLKRHDKTKLGSPCNPGSQYSAVKSYIATEIKAASGSNVAVTSAQTSTVHHKEFFTPKTTKMLAELSEIQVEGAIESDTGAKRTLQFLQSPVKIDEKGVSVSDPEANTGQPSSENEESPTKKTKNKIKQN